MPVCPPTKAVALVNFSSADALSVGSHPVFAAFAPSSSLTRMASALWTDGTALVLPVHVNEAAAVGVADPVHSVV